MHKMTKKNLEDAFSGESQAHMKYLIFADVAEREGKPNVARLFQAIAFAERAHAAHHLRLIGGVAKTEENLKEAMEGEVFEVEEMYAVYDAIAKFQGEKEAERSISYALQAEKIHADMYKKAQANVSSGKDISVAKISVCSICGYTVEGEAPDKCPICGAKKENFKSF